MQHFQFQTLHFDSLLSTNLEAAKRASEGAPEGICIVAREQTAGRGRLGRQWISPRDAGIYCSTLLRPQFDQNKWPLITLMAAVVVHEVLLEACALQTDIKWPNDILYDEKKLCGILAEIIETSAGRAVVVGTGINLTNDAFPAELAETATSIAEATGRQPNREDILGRLQESFVGWYQRLSEPQGATDIVAAWSRRSSYARDKKVRINGGGREISGTTRGLELDGALKVESDDGEMTIVRAGDVSL